MEKILIIGCKKTMNDVCIGCSRCTVAFNRKDGEFARYKDDDAQLLGILNCGDCPGTAGAILQEAEHAVRVAGLNSVELRKMDAENLEFSDHSFDFVYLLFCSLSVSRHRSCVA